MIQTDSKIANGDRKSVNGPGPAKEQFIKILSEVLGSQRIRKVVSSILSQSIDQEEEESGISIQREPAATSETFPPENPV